MVTLSGFLCLKVFAFIFLYTANPGPILTLPEYEMSKTVWNLYSHPRLSLFSDPDRVVLHQAELMNLIATVATLRHYISAIQNINPFIKF